MKSSRLIKIISLLEARNTITTKELSELLSISTRTIRRDMDCLCSMGYPICSKRGRKGGWYLLDNFKSSLKTLTNEEVDLLSLAPSNQVIEDLKLFDVKFTLENKLKKINYKFNKKYTFIDSTEWFKHMENNELVFLLHEAIKEANKVSISYTNNQGISKTYILDGLGLVLKLDEWYLVAKKDESLYRTFKISRIEHIKKINGTYKYPEDFSLEEYWKEFKLQFQTKVTRYEVSIKVDIKDIYYIERYFRVTNISFINNNKALLLLLFDDEKSAIRTLLGFYDLISIISPSNLAGKIQSRIKTIWKSL